MKRFIITFNFFKTLVLSAVIEIPICANEISTMLVQYSSAKNSSLNGGQNKMAALDWDSSDRSFQKLMLFINIFFRMIEWSVEGAFNLSDLAN